MKLVEAYQMRQMVNIRHLYRKSFPRPEKKPFFLLLKKRKEGFMEILSIEDEHGRFLGMAVMILHRDLALLDYFAIVPEYRDGGIGSTALQMLKKRYSGKQFFLEIESPETESPNVEQRKRRKKFYLGNGMKEMPFKVNLFGTDMEILGDACTFGFSEYYEIYQKVFGADIAARKVKLRSDG